MALLRSVLEGRTGLCESDRNPVDWNRCIHELSVKELDYQWQRA